MPPRFGQLAIPLSYALHGDESVVCTGGQGKKEVVSEEGGGSRRARTDLSKLIRLRT